MGVIGSASSPDTCRPVNIASGTKFQIERDVSVSGAGSGFELNRIYNKAQTLPGLFGPRWGSTFDNRLGFQGTNGVACTIVPGLGAGSCSGIPSSSMAYVWVYRGDGARYSYAFNSAQNRWLPINGSSSAYAIFDTTLSQWIFHDEDGSVLTYSNQGRLLSRVDQYGVGWTLIYTEPYLLQTATSTTGKVFHFYWTNSKVTSVVDPAGQTYTYGYNSSGYLSGVTYPGSPSHTRTYLYEVSGKPYLLTGIVMDGTRFSLYAYNSDDTVLHSGVGSSGTYEESTFSYATNPTRTTVTSVSGAVSVYTFQLVNGLQKLASVSQSGVTGCPNAAQSISYDAYGNPSSALDWNGNQTLTSYDSNGRLLSKTTGINSSFPGEERLTTYNWLDGARLNWVKHYGANTSQPIDEVDFAYIPDGTAGARRLRSVTHYNRSAYGVSGQAQTTSYSYSFYSNGTISAVSIDGPVDGNGDITTYHFDTSGNLTSVVNALSQVASFSNFTGNGWPQTVTGPNGDVTKFAYDYSGAVTSKTRVINGANVTTAYVYNGLGQPKTISYPDGRIVTKTYTESGFLAQVQDSSDITVAGSGNETLTTTAYLARGYDVLNNLTGIYKRTQNVQTCSHGDDGCTAGTTTYTMYSDTYSRDQLGRVTAENGSKSQIYSASYDPNGNQLTSKDALNRQHTYSYNGNNELLYVSDPLSGMTTFGYDSAGNANLITDPKGNSTIYHYDGLGNLITVQSPDAGTTTYSYDNGGRLQTITRPDSSTLMYSYDVLNRVTQVSGPSVGISYYYDTCSNGLGRLCSVVDSTGSTAFTYTASGQLDNKTSSINSVSFTVDYNYDAIDRPWEIVYPGGNKVDYTFGSEGKVVAVAAVIGGTTYNVAHTSYMPFGPMAALTYGNGAILNFTWDTSYRLTKQFATGLLNWSYGYDSADQTTSFTDALTAANSATYAYDALSELKTVTSSGGNQAYTYDATQNRQTSTWGGGTDSLVVPAGNNRLNSITGTRARSYTYDPSGNVQTIAGWGGSYTMTHNSLGDLISLGLGGTTQYSYSGLGDRVRKSGPSGSFDYVYGQSGALIGETANGGSTLASQYVYLNGTPVALIRNGSLYYVHNDQAGRPTLITNSAKSVVWKSQAFAFYSTITADSIGGFNLRYPGQYYDAESGFAYNGARYYDPATGRYLESDPLGIGGGINTYAYAGGNPLSFVDPNGLYYIYDQATGEITHVEPGGPITSLGKGYAGLGIGLNNPAFQGVSNIGVLPVGTYTISPQQLNITGAGHKLAASMRLVPDRSNQMFGRGGFLMHGAKRGEKTQSSSNGCPILAKDIRDQIGNSGDNTLWVLP